MRERFKQLLKQATNNSEEYVVRGDNIGRSGHNEVSGDVDGSIQDHRNLLKEDQNCVEKTIKVDQLDSSNDADCQCDNCLKLKAASDNRIMNRIISAKY